MKRFSLSIVLLLILVVFPAAPVQSAILPHLAEIGMDQVWADPNFAHLTGSGQSIAILDTGIDTEHILFDSRIVGGVNFVSGLAPLGTSTEPYRDGHGHGSYVASIAAGSNNYARANGQQIGGVAPQANIVPLRVLDDNGSGAFSNIYNALLWIRFNADSHNIGVVNLSLGSLATYANHDSVANQGIAQQINTVAGELNAMGIPVVAASGNGGSTTGMSFPAILDNIISVGASSFGQVASFTNRTPELDLLAPGANIWGAYAGLSENDPHNLITSGSGTSAAAPLVSAAFLLMNELYLERVGLEATTAELLDILQSTGTPITEGANTWSQLDVYAALTYIDGLSYIPEPGSILIVFSSGLALLMLRRRAA